MSLFNFKNVTIQFQISSSSNKSRPGTCFKMCSRSRQYERFEYDQKLLAESWIGAFSKQVICFCPVTESTPTTLDSVQTFPGNVCTESAEIQFWEWHLSKMKNSPTLCRHFSEMSAQSQYSQTPILCRHFSEMSAQNLKKKFEKKFELFGGY